MVGDAKIGDKVRSSILNDNEVCEVIGVYSGESIGYNMFGQLIDIKKPNGSIQRSCIADYFERVEE